MNNFLGLITCLFFWRHFFFFIWTGTIFWQCKAGVHKIRKKGQSIDQKEKKETKKVTCWFTRSRRARTDPRSSPSCRRQVTEKQMVLLIIQQKIFSLHLIRLKFWQAVLSLASSGVLLVVKPGVGRSFEGSRKRICTSCANTSYMEFGALTESCSDGLLKENRTLTSLVNSDHL